MLDPKGPSTQHLGTLVPQTMKGRVFDTKDLTYWVLGISGGLLLRNLGSTPGLRNLAKLGCAPRGPKGVIAQGAPCTHGDGLELKKGCTGHDFGYFGGPGSKYPEGPFGLPIWN